MHEDLTAVGIDAATVPFGSVARNKAAGHGHFASLAFDVIRIRFFKDFGANPTPFSASDVVRHITAGDRHIATLGRDPAAVAGCRPIATRRRIGIYNGVVQNVDVPQHCDDTAAILTSDVAGHRAVVNDHITVVSMNAAAVGSGRVVTHGAEFLDGHRTVVGGPDSAPFVRSDIAHHGTGTCHEHCSAINSDAATAPYGVIASDARNTRAAGGVVTHDAVLCQIDVASIDVDSTPRSAGQVSAHAAVRQGDITDGIRDTATTPSRDAVAHRRVRQKQIHCSSILRFVSVDTATAIIVVHQAIANRQGDERHVDRAFGSIVDVKHAVQVVAVNEGLTIAGTRNRHGVENVEIAGRISVFIHSDLLDRIHTRIENNVVRRRGRIRLIDGFSQRDLAIGRVDHIRESGDGDRGRDGAVFQDFRSSIAAPRQRRFASLETNSFST